MTTQLTDSDLVEDEETRMSDEEEIIQESHSQYEIVPIALAVHPCGVNAVATTANYKWMITGSDDGYIRKYDVIGTVNGDLGLTMIQKHGLVDSIQKGGVLVSAWENNVNKSIPVQDQDTITSQSQSPVLALDIHSEGVWAVSGLENGDVNLYSVRHDEGTCVHTFRKHKGAVSVLKVTSDERRLLSGSWDKTVNLWDLDTGISISSFPGFRSQLTSLSGCPTSTSQDSAHLYLFSSIDGYAYVADIRTPTGIVKSFAPTESKSPPWCMSACWDISGSRIYCGRRNGAVDVFDLKNDTFVKSIQMPRDSGQVSHVKALPNGRHLLCASFDNIRLWDLQQLESNENNAVKNEHEEKTLRYAKNSMEFDLELDPVSTPFAIVPGHHGGVISALEYNSDCNIMISTSGTKGWDGVSNNMCLMYQVNSI